jgi:hypothetical protein
MQLLICHVGIPVIKMLYDPGPGSLIRELKAYILEWQDPASRRLPVIHAIDRIV